MVDLICLAPVLLFVGWLAFKVAGVPRPAASGLRVDALVELFLEGGSAAALGPLTVAAVILMLYGFLFKVTTGATLGMRLLRLQVIDVYGERPQWWRAALRCVGTLLGAGVLGLGLLWIGFDREKRGLADWLAGTYVIRAHGDSGTTAPAPAGEAGAPAD